ncbi:hypothetical protein HELRODRAFT_192444 [Helobdella robusta]|uniref:DH domain-containing protein n=1 Tax=Helobdella robusta TaxID=6412 RepID=T1FTZ0_HELRO|nr:hypothetical protein HELRODRAFT_192444 [Helobdella robusta]ESO00846.1 hypothetical protein HELRODRAFT_192444 [Helobdella robusta]
MRCPSPVDVDFLFCNMLEVVDISQKLLNFLEAQTSGKEFFEQIIGLCFEEVKDDLRKVYAVYCRNHDDVISYMAKLEQDKEAQLYFNHHLQQLRKSLNVFDLSSILIKPVQRIMKYPLLIGELVKPHDETFQQEESNLKGMMTTIKNLIKDLTTYIDYLQVYFMDLESFVVEVCDMCRDGIYDKEVPIVGERYSYINETLCFNFKDQITTDILPNLNSLLTMYQGPQALIRKRQHKLLDYDNAVIRLKMIPAHEQTKFLRDEVDFLRRTYEALHTQLLEDLPLLHRYSKSVVRSSLMLFFNFQKTFQRNVREEVKKVLQQPSLSRSSSASLSTPTTTATTLKRVQSTTQKEQLYSKYPPDKLYVVCDDFEGCQTLDLLVAKDNNLKKVKIRKSKYTMVLKAFKTPSAITLLAILVKMIESQGSLSNIALGTYTYNSSAFKLNYFLYYDAFYAVDGQNGLSGSSVICFLTVPGFKSNWIGVDLVNFFKIIYTILYAGADQNDLPTRNDLDFFIVGVSNRSLDVHPPVGGTYDLCVQYPGVVAPKQVVQLNCSSTTPPARYVILQQPSNSTGYMSVCEFEVYGTPYGKFKTNLLLKSPSTSSSYLTVTCGPLTAALVVDGFHDSYIYHCHCGHTADAYGGPNWFKFDMNAGYNVDYIVLSNRRWEDPPSDMDILARRLSNFTIGLTNATSAPVRNNYPLCATWPGYVKIGSQAEMKCNANLPKYRYLIVQGSPTAAGYLTICELEAYEPADKSTDFIF